MKNYRMIVPIILIGLMLLSWYELFDGYNTKRKLYEDHLSVARENAEIGIVSVARKEYDMALNVLPSYELEYEITEMYEKQGFEKDYVEWLEKLTNNYPSQVKPYEKLMKYYIENENYSSSFALVEKANKNGIDSKYIKENLEKIRYVVKEGYSNFSEVIAFYNGYCAVCNTAGQWGCLDANMTLSIPCQYKSVGVFNQDGLLPVVNDKDETFYVDTGDARVKAVKKELKYAEFGSMIDNALPVKMESGKYQILDNDLKRIGKAEFDYLSNFLNGIAAAKNGNEWFFVNTNGEKQFGSSYAEIKLTDELTPFAAERSFVKNSAGKYIMIDQSGKQVGSDQYDDCYMFKQSSSFTSVKINGKWVFIDANGKKKNDKTYDAAKPFNNGIAPVCIGGYWGFVNMQDKVIIEPEYEDVNYFTSKGRCLVKKNERWTSITLISMAYDV